MDQTAYGDTAEGYFAIEAEMKKKLEQRAGVKSSECSFRVEYRYPKGTKHWQYFMTYEDALAAQDSSCRYSIYGHAIVERPTSTQVQVGGQRDGWSKYRPIA